MNSSQAVVNAAIKHLQAGKMAILVDDPDRENEGDLMFAAQFVNPQSMNFMLKHCSGIVCLVVTEEHARQLDLKLMVPAGENTNPKEAAFTVSIEASTGIESGVSAKDRALTIQAASHPQANMSDIVKPGHIFPLIAREGGVLERCGHTEGSMDMVKLAGLNPAAVICELMNEDGTMMRGVDLIAFAKSHDIVILTIQDIIQYRQMKLSESP